jgi:PEP-CTERM motif
MSRQPRFISKAMATIAIGLATFAATPSAQASELDFRYVLSGEGSVLTGTFDGTLLSDGNDFEVTSVSSLFVNGVGVAPPTEVFSKDDIYVLGTHSPAEVSLDGSYMNLYLVGDLDVLAFAVGDQTAADFGFPAVGATTGYGGSNFFEVYSSADWSASLGAVPEPGSFALLGTGVLGLAGVVRRKLRPCDVSVDIEDGGKRLRKQRVKIFNTLRR